MGIYDRDYIREDASGGSILAGPGSTTRRVIVATVVVFVLQILTSNWPRDMGFVTEWLALDHHLFEGAIWQVVTYAFLHDISWPFHIFWNMYFLWFLGQELEHIYGPREFLRFYLTAAAFAAVCYLAIGFAVAARNPEHFVANRHSYMLGASGAVSAALVVMAMLYPEKEMLFFFIFPLQLRWLVLLNLIFDLHPILMQLGGGSLYSGVAHGAHLGGMLFGFLYKYYDLRWGRLTGRFSWRQVRRSVVPSRSNVRLYTPPPEEQKPSLDQEVDAILGKISREGEASLTDAERETLKEASRRYKERR